jgi:hypothetical protein
LKTKNKKLLLSIEKNKEFSFWYLEKINYLAEFFFLDYIKPTKNKARAMV